MGIQYPVTPLLIAEWQIIVELFKGFYVNLRKFRTYPYRTRKEHWFLLRNFLSAEFRKKKKIRSKFFYIAYAQACSVLNWVFIYPVPFRKFQGTHTAPQLKEFIFILIKSKVWTNTGYRTYCNCFHHTTQFIGLGHHCPC